MNDDLKKQEKKSYVGIDIGKKTLVCCRLYKDGNLERFQCATDASGLENLLSWLKKTDIVCLEAGNQAFRIARFIIAKMRIEVYALNPGDIANIYNSMRKTDKEDALKLARLIARNPVEELPVVPVPSEEIEAARSLLSEQAYWTKQLTASKNRFHTLFTRAGMTKVVKKEIGNSKRRTELMLELPVSFTKQANRLDENILKIVEMLEELDEEITEVLQENIAYTSIAMSMPGIGPITALAFYSYLEDCRRFSSGSQVSYYAGLVPRVDQSGDTARYGRIIKRATFIKRTLIQGAWSLTKSNEGGEIREFYERLFPRIGKGKAIVATARKMIEVFYAMITSGEFYNKSTEKNLQIKLKKYGLAL